MDWQSVTLRLPSGPAGLSLGVDLSDGGHPETREQVLIDARTLQVLRREPNSIEGHFGLGMAHAAEQRWKDALCEFECARRLEPDNAELQRWLELARGHVGGSAQPTMLPSKAPAKWSPAPAPTRVSACLRL